MTQIIYNVTVNVDDAATAKWLQWMKLIHIPEVLATGCFLHCRLLQVNEQMEGSTGSTYAVQYTAPSQADLNRYFAEHADALKAKTQEQFGNSLVAFRTTLAVLEDFTA